MNFAIEPVTGLFAARDAAFIRDEVFERECGLRVPRLPLGPSDGMLTFIARAEPGSEPAAVLTVMDTTAEHELHRRLGLSFPTGARVARYTQLAVLKPYRGLNIPVQLAIEARRCFISPRRIDYAWLLFDAARAEESAFCRLLGFQAGFPTFRTEYGCSRVLLRNERAAAVEFGGMGEFAHPLARRARPLNDVLASPAAICPDEWLAQ